jgi:hypothetical protein
MSEPQFKPYKEGSRTNWGSTQEGPLSTEQIQLGCQLRMADALEVIAKDRCELERQNKWLKERVERLERDCNWLRNSNRGLRARITVLRKELATMREGGEA